jgi:hypothetical protein
MTPPFRQQFEQIEARRAELLARLDRVPGQARAHPAYKNVRKLLGPSFIKSKLAQRIGVLQSAEWLLNILETMAPTI